MARLTLTDAKNARADGNKPKTYRGDGLQLYVTPKGTKSWRTNYMVAKRNHIAVLGWFPAMSPAEAYAAKAAVHATVRDGGNPKADKHRNRASRAAADGATVAKVGADWVRFASAASPPWTADYKKQVERRLETYVHPKLGAVPIASVSRDQVLDVIHAVAEKYGAQAVHVHQHLSAVFDFAVAGDLCPFNPVQRNRKYLPVRAGGEAEAPRAHVTTLAEARAVLAAVEASQAFPATLLLHRLIALTAVRKLEALEAECCEVDFTAATWTIPARRMKGRRGKKRDHVVVLSRQALEVFAAARALAHPDATLVFERTPGAKATLDRNSLNWTMATALKRAGLAGKQVPHGWRHTFSTIMNEASPVDDRIIDAMLAHKLKGVSGAEDRYNHARYMLERRRVAGAWSDMLLEGAPSAYALVGLAEPESNVVTLREAA